MENKIHEICSYGKESFDFFYNEVSRLYRENEQLKKGEKNLKDDISNLCKEAEENKAEINNLNHDNRRLKEEMNGLNNKIDKFGDKVIRLNEVVEKLEGEKNKLNNDISTLLKEKELLNGSISSLIKEKELLNTSVSNLNGEIVKLKTENTRIKVLEKDLTNKEFKQNQGLMDRLARIEESIENLNKNKNLSKENSCEYEDKDTSSDIENHQDKEENNEQHDKDKECPTGSDLKNICNHETEKDTSAVELENKKELPHGAGMDAEDIKSSIKLNKLPQNSSMEA